MSPESIRFDEDYKLWLADLKSRLRQAQLKAAVSVNTTLLEFYWQLGADIVEKQKSAEWGSGFLARLSHDLMAEFPEMKGFSETNLRFIRRWFLFYNETPCNSVTACDQIELEELEEVPACTGDQKVAQAVPLLAEIPWGHNRVIISKCSPTGESFGATVRYSLTVQNIGSRA